MPNSLSAHLIHMRAKRIVRAKKTFKMVVIDLRITWCLSTVCVSKSISIVGQNDSDFWKQLQKQLKFVNNLKYKARWQPTNHRSNKCYKGTRQNPIGRTIFHALVAQIHFDPHRRLQNGLYLYLTKKSHQSSAKPFSSLRCYLATSVISLVSFHNLYVIQKQQLERDKILFV